MRNCWIILISLTSLMSCVSTKKTAYFNELKETEIASQKLVEELIIQKGDLLDIKITSLNPEASKVFNSGTSSELHNNSLINTVGHLVDANGNIQLPYIGFIKAEGLTKSALKDTIFNKLVSLKLLLDPTVTVRLLNFKFSVLGEVLHPSIYTVQSDKVTILDALAMAGDMTINGVRKKVLVIREENGKTHFERINLLKADVFSSPYYYLKPNDVVYVQPNSNKVFASSKFVTLIPAFMSTVSAIIIILGRVK